MPWHIEERADEFCVIKDDDGANEGCHDSRQEAEEQVKALYATEGEEMAVADPAFASVPGLLPERWVDNGGVAFAQNTGDGRDFSEVAWTWRDPTDSLLPLMFQSVNAPEHQQARLAGFVETLSQTNGTVRASGGFYDNDAGREARDVLSAGDKFGVSVDPGAVDGELVCIEEDADGFCVSELAKFTAYEIIGITMTPFPAFAEAAIRLSAPEDAVMVADGSAERRQVLARLREVAVRPVPVVASATPCECQTGNAATTTVFNFTQPDYSTESWTTPGGIMRTLLAAASGLDPAWFTDPHLSAPTPVTIDGERVFGHVATWDICHTGHQTRCTLAPKSQAGYAYFTTGAVLCSDGSRVKVGQLTMGCGHAPLEADAHRAAAHYDGGPGAVQWADVAAGEDEHGIWVAGALRPGLSEAQVREAQAQALSGDWRNIGGHLELVAALSVPVPGFPIAASGVLLATDENLLSSDAGEPLALVAAGRVEPLSAFVPRGEFDALRAEVAALRQVAAFRTPG